MSTNIQIRSVDDAMATAAKAEAARRRMSLSDYLKSLIANDLDAHSDAARRAHLYAEIAQSAPGDIRPEDTARALADARREMGLE